MSPRRIDARTLVGSGPSNVRPPVCTRSTRRSRSLPPTGLDEAASHPSKSAPSEPASECVARNPSFRSATGKVWTRPCSRSETMKAARPLPSRVTRWMPAARRVRAAATAARMSLLSPLALNSQTSVFERSRLATDRDRGVQTAVFRPNSVSRQRAKNVATTAEPPEPTAIAFRPRPAATAAVIGRGSQARRSSSVSGRPPIFDANRDLAGSRIGSDIGGSQRWRAVRHNARVLGRRLANRILVVAVSRAGQQQVHQQFLADTHAGARQVVTHCLKILYG